MKKAKYIVFVTGCLQDKNGVDTKEGLGFLPCSFESNSRNARKHLMHYISYMQKAAIITGPCTTVSWVTCIVYTDYLTPSETPISRADYTFNIGEKYPVITYGAYKPID